MQRGSEKDSSLNAGIKEKSRTVISARFVRGDSPLERTTGIEPATSAWEANILPLNYVRKTLYTIYYKN